MFSSLRGHGLYSQWNSPGQNTGVGSLGLWQTSCCVFKTGKVKVFPVCQPSQVAKWRSMKVCLSPHAQPLTWSRGCVGSEWHTCVASSSAAGRAQSGTEGGGSTTLSHSPDWRPEATWCKIRQDLPSPSPFSVTPIHLQGRFQGWKFCCLRRAESLTSSFYTDLSPVVSQHLLCELLKWPLPPSDWKLTWQFLD